MRAFSKVVDGRNGFSRVIHGTWVMGRGEGGDGTGPIFETGGAVRNDDG